MEVRERIAYIRGLLEGSEELRAGQKEQNIWENLLEVCDSLAESVSRLGSKHEELEEYVYGIDCDLCDLEDEVYGSSDDGEEDAAPEGSLGAGDADEEASDDDDGMVRAECPRCGEEVYFEESFLYDDGVVISCPDCGETLYRSDDVAADDSKYPQDDVYAFDPYPKPEAEHPSP